MMTGNSLRVHCIPIGLLFLIYFRHVKMWSLPSLVHATPPETGGCSDLGSRIWSDAVLRPRLTAASCNLHSALCAECGDRFIGGTLFISETKLEVSNDLSETPVIYPTGEWRCRCMRLKRWRSWRYLNQLHLKSLDTRREEPTFCC